MKCVLYLGLWSNQRRCRLDKVAAQPAARGGRIWFRDTPLPQTYGILKSVMGYFGLYKSCSFGGDRIQRNISGQTAASICEATFQGLTSSLSSGRSWWLGGTKTDNLVSYCTAVAFHPTPRPNGDIHNPQ